jgi:transcriptional regulator with XRE-family HTH domain/predicted transcriptional regulator
LQDMTQLMNEGNLKIIFGIKIKSYRTHLGLSLQELSKKTTIAISYLSEIESGKKYPKPEKLIRLAQALEVDYDTLVSTKVSKDLDPFAALINSDLIKQFPFHLFGISASDILGLFKNNPEHAHAFLQTFLQISRAYDMSLDNFLFAALRTYVRQCKNYFPDLENLAKQYAHQQEIDSLTPSFIQLKKILQENHSYTVEETELTEHPELNMLRSVLRGKGLLSINGKLLSSQKAFILARELGFLELGIKERPITSSWIKVQSFEQLVNNFKASYFGGAILLQQDRVVSDLKRLLAQPEWDGDSFMELLNMYQATPEMLLHRMSQLLPGVFGLTNVFYFRFVNGVDRLSVTLTKELNMTDSLISYGLGINEHHCRRLLPLRLLQKIHHNMVPIAVGVQKIEFVKSGACFLLLSMARPLSLSKTRGSAIALGIKIDKNSESAIKFLNDPGIGIEKVSESCERCPLTDCSERVAEASLICKQKALEKREAALQRFIGE